MATAKRPRASSSSSSLATDPDLSPSQASTGDPPPHKASRTHPSEIESKSHGSTSSATTTTTVEGNTRQPHPILCNLPPTCHNRPTPITNTIELERHYAKFHAHVCEFNHCGCVFPEERFLELHQTECHDPIAAMRKERNEKIFECHIPAPACGRKFSTPKTRRLHLIQTHNYPKEYFFAVTNKGIGGLLKKWGEGASLIRKEWKPREEGLKDQTKTYDDGDDDDDEESVDVTEPTITDDDDEPADLDATPRIRPRRMLSPTTSQAPSFTSHTKNKYNSPRSNQSAGSADIAGLTQSLNALSLVPNSVRFGRGGKTRGFASGGAAAKSHNNAVGANSGSIPMQVDVGPQDALVGHGGLSGRGRGRGRASKFRGRGNS